MAELSSVKEELFLMGGYDLEMLEIKAMLESRALSFLDAELSWGASWNDYQQAPYKNIIEEAIEGGRTIIGIELADFPDNNEHFHLIDHHNERQDEPSSIEQLATMLNYTLNRRQQLIAANDKGYIPAMQALNASDEEIQEIRKSDRVAQGVSAEDEMLAEKAIKTAERIGDVYVVHTESKRFSPVTDQLFGKAEKLIVCNKEELCYFGTHKDRVANFYKSHISDGYAYEGGGANGFFGISIYKHFNIKHGIEEIIRLLE